MRGLLGHFASVVHLDTRDTRIHVVATAFDYHGNATPASVDVIYQRVDDSTIPRAQWVTPQERSEILRKDLALVDQARKLLRDNRMDESKALVEQILTDDPTNPSGMYLRDASGREILDAVGGAGAVVIGHGVQEITDAVAEGDFFEMPCCTAAISPPMRVRLRFGNCAAVMELVSAYFSRSGA